VLAQAHLPKNTLALQFLFQNPQRLLDIVVSHARLIVELDFA
jgi:hypothetical protein